MNVPKPYAFPTRSSTTTTAASEPPALAELFENNEDEEFEYEDETMPEATVPETPIPTIESQSNLIAKPEDDFAEEIKTSVNGLESAKPSNNVSEEFASIKEAPPIVDEPVILTSNFYLPENVKSEPTSEYEDPEAVKPVEEKPLDSGAEYEYEYEEYEEEPSVGPNLGSTSTTSNTENTKSEVIEESSPSPTLFDEDSESRKVVNDSIEAKTNVDNADDEMEVLGEAVVSVVTTKSVINGSTSTVEPEDMDFYDEEEPITTNQQQVVDKTTPTETIPTPASSVSSKEATTDVDPDYDPEETSDSLEQGAGNSSTENYLVVASVQTSRSVSGARYLPFPQVKQEEKKQSLDDEEDEDDLEETKPGTKSLDPFDNDSIDPTTIPTVRLSSTTKDADGDTEVVEIETSSPLIPLEESFAPTSSTTDQTTSITSSSTESTIDKLDRVQSELLDRSGLLSGKFPILNEMPDPTSTTSTTEDGLVEGTPAPVVIRKFMPRTTAVPRPHKKEKSHQPLVFEDLHSDDLTESLLPAGFKPRNNSYRNKKVTSPSTSATTSSTESIETTTPETHQRSANISRSFKNHPHSQETQPQSKIERVVDQPKPLRGYTTKLPFVTVPDSINIAQFLPPGYKPPKTTKKPQAAVAPPADFKPISDSSSLNINKKPAAYIPIADNIASFLPPGYKAPAEELPAEIPIADDILRTLLPKGYNAPKATAKPKLEAPKIHKFSESDSASKPTDASEINIVDSILNKIQFKDVSALLPPGFMPEVAVTEPTPPETTTKGGFKVVFPKGIKRPGSGRVTTPAPVHSEGASLPPITIRKGLR